MSKKDVRDLLSQAREEGWVVGARKSNHILLRHEATGVTITTASTPSDHRGILNLRADMRRALRASVSVDVLSPKLSADEGNFSPPDAVNPKERQRAKRAASSSNFDMLPLIRERIELAADRRSRPSPFVHSGVLSVDASFSAAQLSSAWRLLIARLRLGGCDWDFVRVVRHRLERDAGFRSQAVLFSNRLSKESRESVFFHHRTKMEGRHPLAIRKPKVGEGAPSAIESSRRPLLQPNVSELAAFPNSPDTRQPAPPSQAGLTLESGLSDIEAGSVVRRGCSALGHARIDDMACIGAAASQVSPPEGAFLVPHAFQKNPIFERANAVLMAEMNSPKSEMADLRIKLDERNSEIERAHNRIKELEGLLGEVRIRLAFSEGGRDEMLSRIEEMKVDLDKAKAIISSHAAVRSGRALLAMSDEPIETLNEDPASDNPVVEFDVAKLLREADPRWLGVRFAAIRKIIGVKQGEVARSLEISQSTLCLYEAGKKAVPEERFPKMIGAIGVSMSDFFGETFAIDNSTSALGTAGGRGQPEPAIAIMKVDPAQNAIIGKRILEARRGRGMSKVEVASRVGCSVGIIGNIERGVISGGKIYIPMIAKVLKVSLSKILGG